MALKSSVVDNKLTFAFDAKMDSNQCRLIEKDLLARVSEWEGAIAFDLQGVDFISSAFLRLAMQTTRAVGADAFSFIHVEPPAKLVLKTAGMDQLISEA